MGSDFYIIQKNSSGIYTLPIESILFSKRTVFLSGEINKASAELFTKQMMALSMEDKNDDVLVVINSPGGEILSGLSILNMMEIAPFKTNVLCTMACYSMAAVIFSSATGKRTMSPHAKLMFHEPLISKKGDSQTPLSMLLEEEKSLKKNKELLKKVIRKRTGLNAPSVSRLFGKDTYFDADEAIEINLCDEITKREKI